MKKSLAIVLLLSASVPAYASTQAQYLDGALGGGAGAATGQNIGGKNGAIMGAAIGGATGAAIGGHNNASAQPIQPVRQRGSEEEDRDRHGREHGRD